MTSTRQVKVEGAQTGEICEVHNSTNPSYKDLIKGGWKSASAQILDSLMKTY